MQRTDGNRCAISARRGPGRDACEDQAHTGQEDPRVASTTALGPREGSKTSRVIELLKREGGVTLQELMAEMGWQSHTTRALMSAGGALAKKHGLTVVSTKGEKGDRIYSIIS
jgi:hypothetical protein